MATKIGPKTVTQRDRSKALVFCIDAACSRSFGGEPTTNSIQNPEFSGGSTTNWNKDGDIVWETIADNNNPANSPYIIKITKGGSGTNVWQNLGTADSGMDTVTEGLAYSHSCYMKGEGTVKIASWDNNSGTKTLASYITLTNEWQFVQMTQTYNGSHLTTGMSMRICSALGLGGGTSSPVLYVCGPQTERSDSGGGNYATPFVNGTRTKANALKNISGVGAQGTTLTGTFASYGNKLYKPTSRRVLASQDVNQGHIGGAYWDLDGSDEWIDTNLQPDFIHTNATLIMWCSSSDLAVGMTHGNHNSKRFYLGVYENYAHGGCQNRNTYSTDPEDAKSLLSTYGVGTDDWMMLALVADSGTARVYVNDTQDHAFAYSQSSGSNPDTNFAIGGWNDTPVANWWDGRVATCMIWSSALTAKEIKDIYIAQKGRFGK